MNPRTIRITLYALIVIGCLVRAFDCVQHNPLDYLFSDPLRHWKSATKIYSKDLMSISDPIVYQVYVKIFRCVTQDNRYGVAFVCALLSIATPWLYYRAARELAFTKNEALAIWAILNITPSLFVIYHFIMMETLLLALVGFSLWMTARYLRKGGSENLLFASLAWLFACSTKPTVVPLACVCIGFVWWRTSRKVRDFISIGALTVICLAPNAMRTKQILGFYAPLGNPWIVKIMHRSGEPDLEIKIKSRGHWIFCSPTCYTQPLRPLSKWMIRRAYRDTATRIVIDYKNGEKDWKEAYENLNVSHVEIFKQWWENIRLFLFSPSWPDNNKEEWSGWLCHYSRWMWFPIIFWVLDFNFREFKQKRFELIPIATTVFTLFLMFQNVALTEGRYRKPVEPLLLINLVMYLKYDKRSNETNQQKNT